MGGAGKDAVLTVLPSANQTLVLATSVVDVRAKGRLELPALGKYYYLETLKIDHGVIDGGGDTAFCMSNQGATECGTEYTEWKVIRTFIEVLCISSNNTTLLLCTLKTTHCKKINQI